MHLPLHHRVRPHLRVRGSHLRCRLQQNLRHLRQLHQRWTRWKSIGIIPEPPRPEEDRYLTFPSGKTYKVDRLGERIINWLNRILRPEGCSEGDWRRSRGDIVTRAAHMGISPDELRRKLERGAVMDEEDEFLKSPEQSLIDEDARQANEDKARANASVDPDITTADAAVEHGGIQVGPRPSLADVEPTDMAFLMISTNLRKCRNPCCTKFINAKGSALTYCCRRCANHEARPYRTNRVPHSTWCAGYNHCATRAANESEICVEEVDDDWYQEEFDREPPEEHTGRLECAFQRDGDPGEAFQYML